MEKLQINLFGVFQASADGVPIRMPTRRVELILALLALSPDKAASRSYLASLLWPGQEDAQARASLRQAIFRLRGALGTVHAPALEATTGWIKLRREAIVLDIDAITEQLDEAANPPEGLPLDGLTGFEPEIEEILDIARADLRRRLVAWFVSASQRAGQDRRFSDLERHARRRLALEPYDEAALRDLMAALWRQGRRNTALQAFRDISQRIRTDLSVAVEPETLELYQSIRSASVRQPEFAHDAELQNDQAVMGTPIGSASDKPPEAPRDDAIQAPVHLRHLAAIHIVSERLRVALRDPDPETAESGSGAAVADIEAVIIREGGEIIGRTGHHVSAVFGARRPDESPALSAALAGFEIAGRDCAVGIHAGAGLIGAQSETFPLVYVSQSLAASTGTGQVLVTAEVETACRGAFAMSEVPPLAEEAGGPDTPVWQLDRETSARGGFDIRMARGLGHFCGRGRELAILGEIAAQDGARVAVVIGEGGIGKSRLVHEFLMKLRPAMLLRVQFSRSEEGGGLGRFASILHTLLNAEPDIPGRQLLEILVDRLSVPEVAQRIRPALAAILGERETMRPWLDLARGRRMQALADAILTVIEAFAGRGAVLLVEDAHWADEDAGLLLERIAISLHAAGPMAIVTMRSGHAEGWAGHDHVRSLMLRPLDADLAGTLLDAFQLPDPTRSAILAKAGGVPLFLEELARAAATDASLIDATAATDDGRPPVSEIPVALRGILSHRIDSLHGAARKALDAAAVLGAEPTDELLAALCGLRREAFDAAITTLADADLLYCIRTFPKRTYAFKHALIQDAAYLGIPPGRRAELHAAVVAAHDDPGGGASVETAALARHALDGGLPERAIDFAMRAARLAAEDSAYALANRMTDLALDAIGRLDPTETLLRIEADILTWRRALLWPLAQQQKMLAGLARAEVIARDLGDDRRLAEVCIHRAYLHSDDGKSDIGLGYCAMAQAAASRADDKRLVAESALAKCQILSLQGKMQAARRAISDHVNDWEERKDALDGLLVTRYVMLHFHLARIAAALGEGGTAWSHIERAAAVAIETRRPVDRYVACRVIGEVCAMTGESNKAIHVFETTREIAVKAELPAYVAWAEAEIAELSLETDARESAIQTLKRLSPTDNDQLVRIAQVKARAALACSASAQDKGAVAGVASALRDAKALAMPAICISLHRDLANRLCDTAPEEALEHAKAANEILTEEKYADAAPPNPAMVDRLVRALRRDR
ncbi:AAA family ATPase [Tropicimonas marinistellae]|uniref:AAA family ATPase n=1 Tax=Tropicimonas marinistellae TaxID=1739787 RepID=UPI000836F7A4|nr:AAA family ATPase [Tropicimonas marinistellae]